MTHLLDRLPDAYDRAAPRWGDRMRALGYAAAYRAFLDAHPAAAPERARVIDVGAGTGAFAEAWLEVNGRPAQLTLLDPSRAMLRLGAAAPGRHGVVAHRVAGRLGDRVSGPFDEVLAAHVIEHCPDAARAMRQMHGLLRPGGTLRLVVSKPHWCNVLIWLRWRHRTFRRPEIVRMLQSAGFRIATTFAFTKGPPSRTSFGLVARQGPPIRTEP